MKLFTEVKSHEAPFSIEPGASIISVGSCFADTITSFLSDFQFDIWGNPFGTLYNPSSMNQLISRSLKQVPLSKEDLFQYEGKHYALSHPMLFTDPNSPEKTLEKINENSRTFRKKLLDASVLIITLGTAGIYKLHDSKNVVANCHKLPNTLFTRDLLTPDETIHQLETLVATVNKHAPNCNIVFTISPVRYVRDSLPENSASKGVLHYALRTLLRDNAHCYYFPSYEILIDELRDYRYYDEKLVQPSNIAKRIIIDRFMEATFSLKAKTFVDQYRKAIAAKQHRFGNSTQISHFVKKQLQGMELLQKKYPEIDFSDDVNYFEDLLGNS